MGMAMSRVDMVSSGESIAKSLGQLAREWFSVVKRRVGIAKRQRTHQADGHRATTHTPVILGLVPRIHLPSGLAHGL